MKQIIRWIGAIVLASLIAGCAFMNRDNTHMLNQVEDNLWPEETAMQVLAFPVVFPIGFAALLVDIVVVHPASVASDAWEDTEDLLWKGMRWEERYVTECAALPWRALFTPVVMTGDFLGRSFFDIPTRAEQERRAREEKEKTAKLDEMLASEDPAARWAAFRLRMKIHSKTSERIPCIEKALKDPSPIIRYAALLMLENRKILHEVIDLVKVIAESDEDPINRSLARSLIKDEED
jgi:hypothetical protein